MARLSYEDQVSVIVSVLKEEIAQIDNLSPAKAKREARKVLMKVGMVDTEGKLTSHYAALRKRHV